MATIITTHITKSRRTAIVPHSWTPGMTMPGMSISGIAVFDRKQVGPGKEHHGGQAATDDQPLLPKDGLQPEIYPFVQLKSYRIQLDFSAPTDTPFALARNVP